MYNYIYLYTYVKKVTQIKFACNINALLSHTDAILNQYKCKYNYTTVTSLL